MYGDQLALLEASCDSQLSSFHSLKHLHPPGSKLASQARPPTMQHAPPSQDRQRHRSSKPPPRSNTRLFLDFVLMAFICQEWSYLMYFIARYCINTTLLACASPWIRDKALAFRGLDFQRSSFTLCGRSDKFQIDEASPVHQILSNLGKHDVSIFLVRGGAPLARTSLNVLFDIYLWGDT